MTLRSIGVVTVLWVALAIAIGLPEPAQAEGLRKVIAVSRFENRTNWQGQLSINDAMADQLIDALTNSGQFTVLERQTVQDVLGEQDFANSGRVEKAESARTGKVTAAQILVKGTITEYQSNAKQQGRGWKFGGFKLNKSGSEAHVGLMIRLIDTTTGEVIDSQRVSGAASAGGTGFEVSGYEQQNSNQQSMEREVGTVRIVEVKEKYARAAPVGHLGPVKRGDLIREQRAPREQDLPSVAASAEAEAND